MVCIKKIQRCNYMLLDSGVLCEDIKEYFNILQEKNTVSYRIRLIKAWFHD